MYTVSITQSRHNWEKQNLVTLKGRKGYYDTMVCSNCGMTGRRYNFEFIEIYDRYDFKKASLCPKVKPVDIPEKVKVTVCGAFGPAFKNLTPDSIHYVVTPPDGYLNDHTGVWVMGVGEPVKLLVGEFTEEK